jgi:DNA-binding beta-propeller fold protein YncE
MTLTKFRSALAAGTAVAGFLFATLAISDVADAASQLMGIEFNSGTLWSINKTTAATSNPLSTGIGGPIDIATAPDARLFTATAVVGPGSTLYTINPGTGVPTAVGPTGLPSLIEGGLAFSLSGTLYATWVNSGDHDLATLNTTTGAGTIVGPSTGADDPSGLAFSSSGTLYMLDAHTNTGFATTLDTLNPSTGAILTTTTLSQSLGSGPLAGLAFDPDTGTLYAASSGSGNLFTINPSTGAVTTIGSLSTLGTDVSGIAFISSNVPEPASAIVFASIAGLMAFRRSRKIC